MDMTQELHFLDTTLLRGLLMGTDAYRDHLATMLGERRFVGRFVDMEFKRSVLLPLINFYNTLTMAHIKTIGDAEKAWSHSFKIREVKLLLSLSGSIFDKHKLDRTNPYHKQRGMMALATAIKSFDRTLRHRFKNPGHDRTHCSRGTKSLQFVRIDSVGAREDLNAYHDEFVDVVARRNECKVDRFFDHHRDDVATCIRHIDALPALKEHDAIRKTAEELRKVSVDRGLCSCSMCEKTGDPVISINAPRQMRLETTDDSFTHWCIAIGQQHRVLTSEPKFLSDLRKAIGAS